MQDFGTKADNSPPPGGQLSAAEFNNLATENENAVLHSGQVLSGASESQLAQSLFLHGVKAESFQDSGAANAYVATPVSGASGVLLPPDYANLSGAVISFRASNTNSGASTLNIGQTTGTLLGLKAIRTQADAALPASSIAANQYIQLVYNPAFDSGNGAWVLLPWSVAAGKLIATQVFPATGTYTPTSGMRICRVRAVGGSGGTGAIQSTAAGQQAAAPGSASGSYAEGFFTSAQIGASQAVTIGAAGSAGIAGGAAAGAGGQTSLGALLTCPGSLGGSIGPATSTTTVLQIAGSTPGAVAAGGTIVNMRGQIGGNSLAGGGLITGYGGSGPLGAGGPGVGIGATGIQGTGFGAGTSGSSNDVSSAAKNGVAGSLGGMIIEEYT